MKNKLFTLVLLAAFAATGEWSAEFNSPEQQAVFKWPSGANQPHTVLATTNLLEGFAPLATVQATPPSNIWWTAMNLPARFFKLQDDTVPNNQIQNGSFFQGLENWTVLVNSAATATVSVINEKLNVDITEGGTAHWHIAVRQFGLELLTGTRYVVEFDAQASAERTMQVRLQSADGSVTYLSKTVSVGTMAQTLQAAFTMNELSDLNARLQFSFGDDDNSVWIDNVVLRTGELRDAARTMNTRLGCGNNFMASKAMNENGAPEDYALLNAAHFAHCRIGYKMDEVSGGAPGFMIPPANMHVLQNMVDGCLAEGLIAVVNPIHNWANNGDPDMEYDPDDLPKLGKIWEQVAAHFAEYDPEHVVFEVMNEPHGEDHIADILVTALAAIRSQPGNERRIVIVPGDGFSTRQALIDAFNKNEIPANDPFLIGTFHYYDPKTFTKQGSNGEAPQAWSTSGELALVVTNFDEVVSANSNWAANNGTEPLPVYLGEFGVDNEADLHNSDRKRWLSWIRMQAEARDFSWAHWNMYANNAAQKGMGPWTTVEQNHPEQRTFDADPVEALIGRYEAENGSRGGDVSPSAEYAGFTGTGYAAFPTGSGVGTWARVENIYIPASTNYTVKIHYASEVDRSLRLVSRNDTATVQTLNNLLFPATGGLNSWRTLEVSIAFEAGESGNLKVVATPDPGVNLDWIHVALP